ncbi:MAG: beta-N-acetylglucosaminidase domain-containing protein [Erysipelotrichales bacterium]|nr:beta-N-acetylglucosaminidase domain-containing protein [Erysipelotrichales bacterium]
MKKFIKLLFAASVLFAPLLSSNVKTAIASQEEYEIYPLPHDIEYHDDYFNIPKSMTCYFEEGIDESTKNRAYDVLGGHDIIAKPSDKISGTYNLIIGIYDNKGYAYNHSSSVDYIETKFDAYYLKVEKENIIILGKDTDAAFYGLASLEYIFNQVTNKVRTLEIRDYSDSKYRGFIEGFYGTPHSPEQREELMRFGSKNKANIYIYAPKDDQYHSSKWRSLYDDLAYTRLKEQVAEGIRTKTRFCYALHPFINDPITPSNYDISMQQLFAKLQQIYDAGVRQFCISGDDAILPYGMTSSEYAKMQNGILNTISNWVKQKGDCYNLVFVSSAYCYKSEYWLGFDLETYYQGLMNADGTALDESIEIMWTGNDVCSTLGDGHLPDFIRMTGRKPFIWMNYPVNDFNPKIILMGPGEVYNLELEDEVLFTGIVANMALEAEPSKVAIFNTCDYTWNSFDYDMYTSYDNSFKYIEANAYEALREICQHLRNTGNLFSGAYFTEGTELLELIEKFELAREKDSYKEETEDLIEYFVKLKNACKTFKETAANKALLKTMKPWVDGIEFAALSGEGYLTAILHQNDYAQSKLNYIVKEAELNQLAATHRNIKSPNAVTYNQPYVDVMFGHNVLMPFINDLNAIAKNEASSDGVKILMNYGEGDYVSKIYDGLLNNMVDGDLNTYVTFEKPSGTDSFYMFPFDITLDYGTTQSISKIDIYQGSPNSWIPFAECMRGDILASNDGVNWTHLVRMTLDPESPDADHPRGLPYESFTFDTPIEARYLKFANYYTVCWITIREIAINDSLLHPAQGTMYYNGLELQNDSKVDDILDNDSSTSVAFTATEENTNVLIDLLSIKNASGLHVLFEENKSLSNYKIEISKDGYDFEILETDLTNYETLINFDTIKEIRYLRLSGMTEANKQIVLTDFTTLN